MALSAEADLPFAEAVQRGGDRARVALGAGGHLDLSSPDLTGGALLEGTATNALELAGGASTA